MLRRMVNEYVHVLNNSFIVVMQRMLYKNGKCTLAGWLVSLISLFSTNMAMSETKGQG